MGEQQISDGENGHDSRSFMGALLRDLRALEEILDSGAIETSVRRIGVEQELFLVDSSGHPALIALDVLNVLQDPHYTTELGLFNLEFNLDPMVLEGAVLRQLEMQITSYVERVRTAAATVGGDVVLVGILPTARKSDLSLDSMTPLPRYKILNDILGQLRGGPYDFRITGVDELSLTHDNVMLEACNTSFQLHFQVEPEEFAPLYNIAQAVAPPVLAAATNSPFLFGKNLWQETRIPLFRQSIDTRKSSQYVRERSPRVHFGNSWVRESVLELFREDIARYRALIGPPEGVEDPFEKLAAGEAPRLQALCLHNGTVYRWNRPCYGITEGKPHLRIENRILPSGPTPRDEVANAAFWFGLISGLSHTHPDISKVIDFGAVRGNFMQAARYGLSAQFEWVDGTIRPAQELITEHLLPMAREGLEDKDVNREHIDLYLGVIADRVAAEMTGSRWLTKSFTSMPKSVSVGERFVTLTTAMISRQKEGKPVHQWPLATAEESRGWQHGFLRVEQVMTTDLFSVQEDEPLELVAQLMDWERIRHMLVEDPDGRLTGLISYRAILRVLARGEAAGTDGPIRVADVMLRDPISVTPETATLSALRLMRKHGIGCLPVIKGQNLVGVVTEADFMVVAGKLLEDQLAEEFEEDAPSAEPAPES